MTAAARAVGDQLFQRAGIARGEDDEAVHRAPGADEADSNGAAGQYRSDADAHDAAAASRPRRERRCGQ